MAAKKYPVRFMDGDNKEDGKFRPVLLEDEERQLPAEEWPEVDDIITLSRRSNLTVASVQKVYGVKGLLRLVVTLTKRSRAQRVSDQLAAKATDPAARVKA